MGTPMARRIARAGHSLTVWNRALARTQALVAEPAISAAATPAEAAAQADVVITMLADPVAVLSVAEQALAAMAPGTLLLEMSTVDPATIHSLAARAAQRGIELVDAPVSGSRRPAEEGTLLILAAGERAGVERVRPLLETMGEVHYVGPSGSGAAMKLVLNGLGAHMLTGFTSMLVLGKRLGLAPERILEVVQSGAFSSPQFTTKGSKILARDFSPDFRMALFLKDQELVLKTAESLGMPLPVLESIRVQIAAAVTAGWGELDLSALIQQFE